MSTRAAISAVVKRLGSQPRWLWVPVLAAPLIMVQVVPAAAAGGWPFTVGGGWATTNTLREDKFAFSATNGPNARDKVSGYGRFDLSSLGLAIQGPVSCVYVSSDTATFHITAQKSSDATVFSLRCLCSTRA
jgi:hypothetical protein